MTATLYLNELNQRYLTIHKTKETFFWETYMGVSDNHDASAQAQVQWTNFLSQASQIEATQQAIDAAELIDDPWEKQQTLIGLHGWLNTFKAHTLESEEAQSLKEALIKFEAELFEKNKSHTMTYRDENGELVEGSLPTIGAVIRTNDNGSVRQSAHQALLSHEQWLLGNGLLELVKLRNKLARSLGYDSFFDYSIVKTESMTTEQLFGLLDDFELRTRDSHLKSLHHLVQEKGEQAVAGHNFVFSFAGDVMRELDQYVPFSQSLRRWADSFGRLNIDYSNAELTLDLLDRKGKYPNGFCHGPVPAFYDQGDWIAAKVNFTSNAKPDQVGCGYDGINTLFHEGGHAAHFANVKMNAPCFSLEFAPTSMAYAETQSMFCDSLLTDADWLKQYARNADGDVIPDAVIYTMIESRQPFKAYEERSILVVPYFERELYQLSDDELTPERVTKLARDAEKRVLGLECSPRPLIAIPHLLSDESACSYQGYLLAHMAVYQTRSYLIEQFGYLTDNPHVGPLLAKHYWLTGNSVSHDQTIKSLTGEGFNAKYLADACNLTSAEAKELARQKIEALNDRERTEVAPLNAVIRVVDGTHVIASNRDGDMCQQFELYVAERYGC